MPSFHICKVINDRAYDPQDTSGHGRCASVADIQLLMPAECKVRLLPDITAFRWTHKYINDPFLMPHLKWQKSSVGYVQTLDKNVDNNVNSTDLKITSLHFHFQWKLHYP